MDQDVEAQWMEVDLDTLLVDKIVQQIHYYFGDINLSRDKYMKSFADVGEGWMPLDTLMTFKRLANLTKNKGLVILALYQTSIKLVELNKDCSLIRRNPAFPMKQPQETREKIDVVPRTIYVKGFPEDVTLDMLLQFYRMYNPDRIKMRKYKRKDTDQVVFKGSIFLTFKTIQEAENYVLERSVYNGVHLEKMKQSDFVDQKVQQKEYFRLAKIRDISLKRAKRPPLPLGTLLFLHSIPMDITVEMIKRALNEHGGVPVYVNLTDGVAWIRLRDENSASKVYFSCNGVLQVEESALTVVVITGLLELRFLTKIEEEISKARRLKEQKRQQRRCGLSRREKIRKYRENHANNQGNCDQSTSDQGTSYQGNWDQGNSDQGTSDLGNWDQGNSDQSNSDLGINWDQGTIDLGNWDQGNSDQSNSDLGNCDQYMNQDFQDICNLDGNSSTEPDSTVMDL